MKALSFWNEKAKSNDMQFVTVHFLRKVNQFNQTLVITQSAPRNMGIFDLKYVRAYGVTVWRDTVWSDEIFADKGIWRLIRYQHKWPSMGGMVIRNLQATQFFHINGPRSIEPHSADLVG